MIMVLARSCNVNVSLSNRHYHYATTEWKYNVFLVWILLFFFSTAANIMSTLNGIYLQWLNGIFFLFLLSPKTWVLIASKKANFNFSWKKKLSIAPKHMFRINKPFEMCNAQWMLCASKNQREGEYEREMLKDTERARFRIEKSWMAAHTARREPFKRAVCVWWRYVLVNKMKKNRTENKIRTKLNIIVYNYAFLAKTVSVYPHMHARIHENWTLFRRQCLNQQKRQKFKEPHARAYCTLKHKITTTTMNSYPTEWLALF